jgi:hypothetical protein
MSRRIVSEVMDRSPSAKQVGLIDADLVGLGFAGEELRAELTASPLFQAVPAVARRACQRVRRLRATTRRCSTCAGSSSGSGPCSNGWR